MKNKNLYAVILAGGSGTRFWPKSRQSKPKQFLDITGRGTLLQETIRRLKSKVAGDNMLIVTNKAYSKVIAEQTAEFKIPKGNILLEPGGKNTAPAICWAVSLIHQRNKNAVMGVFPSDHLILNQKKFLQILEEAVELAKQEYLVTFGIIPNRPETGYGYIKTVKRKMGRKNINKVAQFTEKPSSVKAQEFVKKGYFWNSGMFVWRSEALLKAFYKYLPDVYELLGEKSAPAYVRKIWPQLPSISIDYGILEKADNVVAVPAKGIDWSDLGSWESLSEVLEKDQNGNILRGDIVFTNCKNSLVWGQQRLIATVGLEDIVIIDTPDSLLVCRKDLSQNVKDIVDQLKKKKRKEL